MAYMVEDFYRPGAVMDFPRGGSGQMAAALARGVTKHKGCYVRTSTPVERVVVEGGRATGVELRGGRQARPFTVPHRCLASFIAAPVLCAVTTLAPHPSLCLPLPPLPPRAREHPTTIPRGIAPPLPALAPSPLPRTPAFVPTHCPITHPAFAFFPTPLPQTPPPLPPLPPSLPPQVRARRAVVSNADLFNTYRLIPRGAHAGLKQERDRLAGSRLRMLDEDSAPADGAVELCKSFMHVHLGITGEGLEHLPPQWTVVNDWSRGIDAPGNVIVVSMPSKLDPALAPARHHVRGYRGGRGIGPWIGDAFNSGVASLKCVLHSQPSLRGTRTSMIPRKATELMCLSSLGWSWAEQGDCHR